jgi:hypothetical protein
MFCLTKFNKKYFFHFTAVARQQQPKSDRLNKQAKILRPNIIGLRLSDAELERLRAQQRLDGRDLSDILRDWFNHTPDPRPLPYHRRLSPTELLNYRRLLDLTKQVWKLRQQLDLLPLPAWQLLADEVLRSLQQLADVLVPATGEQLNDPFDASRQWYEAEILDTEEEGMFFADLPAWRKLNGEPFPENTR